MRSKFTHTPKEVPLLSAGSDSCCSTASNSSGLTLSSLASAFTFQKNRENESLPGLFASNFRNRCKTSSSSLKVQDIAMIKKHNDTKRSPLQLGLLTSRSIQLIPWRRHSSHFGQALHHHQPFTQEEKWDWNHANQKTDLQLRWDLQHVLWLWNISRICLAGLPGRLPLPAWCALRGNLGTLASVVFIDILQTSQCSQGNQ